MNNDTTTPKPDDSEQPSPEGLDGAACSSSFCPTCGQLWPKEKKYKRIKKGTMVKHLKRGWVGHVFSYAQCEKGTCGVDFGENGKWCEAFRSLEIIETNAERIHGGAETPNPNRSVVAVG